MVYSIGLPSADEEAPDTKLDHMNVNKLPYEAPVADPFKLSAAPMDICVQFSGDADFGDFEEGEAL